MSAAGEGPRLPVRLDGGGDGWARTLDGLVLALVLPRAFAPGAPVRLTAWPEAAPLQLEGRTIGSRRRQDGGFDVRARLVNLRREARERLVEALKDTNAS